MTRKKESAGGTKTTQADSKQTSKIIAFRTRCKQGFIRSAQLLASLFRGLA